MSVAFDARFEEHSAGQASPFSFTSGSASNPGSVGANSNRVLIAVVGLSNISTTAIAVTWNGVTMTQIGTTLANTAVGCIAMFGLIAPATGSHALAATWTGGAADISLGAISVFNADQVTGWQNTGSDTANSTSASSAVTTVSGNMGVVGHVNDNASSTTPSAGTSAWNEGALNGNYAASYLASVSTTDTITWTLGTSVEWHNIKADIIVASAGGGPTSAIAWIHQ